jgi:methionyl-tRNA synthetase
MIEKYRHNVIPAAVAETDVDLELKDAGAKMVADYRQSMSDFQFHRGLQAVWEFVGMANRYIVRSEPWLLVKDEKKQQRLDTVLYNLAESLRLLALVLKPVMPETAAKMQRGLGIKASDRSMVTLGAGGDWGHTKPGTSLQRIESLFPRVDVKKNDQQQSKKKTQKAASPESPQGEDGLITYEQFQGVDLKVARVTSAERVPKSERLLKLTVEVPEERTIVAGIGEFYTPEALLDTYVIVVANLKPAKLMGIASQGMILAAKTEDDNGAERLVLASIAGKAKPGSKVA